jgi:hypothetical protein
VSNSSILCHLRQVRCQETPKPAQPPRRCATGTGTAAPIDAGNAARQRARR